MGEVKIRDGEREVTSFLTPWKGTIVIKVNPNGKPRLILSADSPFSPAEVEVEETEIDSPSNSVFGTLHWILLAPAIAGAVALTLVVSGAIGSLAPAHQPEITVALVLLVVFVAATGDLRLYNDARRLESIEATWQPDPWLYVLSGGVVLTLAAWVWIGTPADPLSQVRVVAGYLVVGSALSSAVTGPIYLINRGRKAGLT